MKFEKILTTYQWYNCRWRLLCIDYRNSKEQFSNLKLPVTSVLPPRPCTGDDREDMPLHCCWCWAGRGSSWCMTYRQFIASPALKVCLFGVGSWTYFTTEPLPASQKCWMSRIMICFLSNRCLTFLLIYGSVNTSSMSSQPVRVKGNMSVLSPYKLAQLNWKFFLRQ